MSKLLYYKVEQQLKKDFEECCEKKGCNVSDAIVKFVVFYSKTGRIPFALNAEPKYPNKELVLTSVRMKDEVKEEFNKACRSYHNTNMNKIICSFMNYCVLNDCLFNEDIDTMIKYKKLIERLEATIKQHKEFYDQALETRTSMDEDAESTSNVNLFKGAIYGAEMIEVAIRKLKQELSI